MTDTDHEEQEEFDSAFDEAISVLDLRDKRNDIQSRIEQLEKFASKTPKEELERQDALKGLYRELRAFTEPKRSNQRHRLKVREIAKTLWQKNPDWTIQKLIENDEVKAATRPREYSVRTLRSWIKDLAPDRRPGRRKAHH